MATVASEHVCPTCSKVIMRPGPFKRHTNVCGRTYSFEELLDIGKVIVPETDANTACWMWTLGVSKNEKYGRWRHVRSHRWIYEAVHGPIPSGLDICHSCDNPGCVNPAHLRADTRSSNIQESFDKGRSVSPMLREEVRETMKNSLPENHGQYIAHMRHHVRKNTSNPACTFC